MNKEEQSRFAANVKWFNQFFDGIKQLYGIVVEELPNEFFPESFKLASTNFYFPKQNRTPSIPPYYVLGLGGKQFALQVLTVLDSELFTKSGHFAVEPSVVIVLHSHADKYLYFNDYALRVIGNRGIGSALQTGGKVSGKISGKRPADFFSFQVPFDKLSADQNSRDAVREHIVNPIIEYLEKR